MSLRLVAVDGKTLPEQWPFTPEEDVAHVMKYVDALREALLKQHWSYARIMAGMARTALDNIESNRFPNACKPVVITPIRPPSPAKKKKTATSCRRSVTGGRR